MKYVLISIILAGLCVLCAWVAFEGAGIESAEPRHPCPPAEMNCSTETLSLYGVTGTGGNVAAGAGG